MAGLARIRRPPPRIMRLLQEHRKPIHKIESTHGKTPKVLMRAMRFVGDPNKNLRRRLDRAYTDAHLVTEMTKVSMRRVGARDPNVTYANTLRIILSKASPEERSRMAKMMEEDYRKAA